MTPPDFANDPRIRAALDRAIELGEIGYADKEGTPADENTLFPVFSVTKGITSLAVHIQADRGLIDIQDSVSKYWPEFAAAGKERITIEQVLSHRSGVPQMPANITPELMANWQWMVEQIAHLEPLYPPNTANAYHVLVWGWVLGEIVRRTDVNSRPFHIFINEEILLPLGISPRNLNFGVPDDDLPRVATLYGGNEFPLLDNRGDKPEIGSTGQTVDPSAGVIATAASVARIFALLAEGGQLDGVRLLSSETIRTFTRPRTNAKDPDKVIGIPVWVGKAGFWVGGELGYSDSLVGDHGEIIYSAGAGGSLAWADLRDHIAVAICHNNMDSPAIMQPERTFAPIVRAVGEIVAERRNSN
ncbi:hypothetical protein AJ79_02938 [Helicocarpus griseus UAMH5409]|uniref:Beta-lactamase-related domain-containing protein n=1 Tax=Helicocarpus griseus UAMH5409 TaxID=1447875 RepID=A0A2B7Y0P3_9EURO|nr:hypothetical protein AJ79_02938 [Helicocarpus griseus UAMH5409]